MANNTHNLGAKTDTISYAEAARQFFREHWHPLKGASKLLGRLGRSSDRSAENWLDGTSAPSGEAMLWLMANDPKFESFILQLVEERKCKKPLKLHGAWQGQSSTGTRSEKFASAS